jgi:hypothetical protein
MRNHAYLKDTHYHPQYKITPSITTIAIPLLIGRTEKARSVEQPSEQKAKKPKQKSTRVEKYEVSQFVLKLLVEKGLFKKRWVAIKEIPINEITLIKILNNELSITLNGINYSFIIKNKGSSFSGLPEQIQNLIKEQQKNLEGMARTNEIKCRLAELIDAAVCIVDLSFDMLMALQAKTVNWTNLEIYTKSLKDKMCFTQQTLTPLNLDFSKISDAIKSQAPEEASKEIFNVLNSIYGYFDNLELEEDLEAVHPTIADAKVAILASYMLNDLFLGKIVGEKDNQKESQALETTLQKLAKDTNFKINFQDFKANFDKIDPYAESENIIESTREIFKEQLRNINHSIKELSIGQSLTEQAVTPPPESQLITSQEIQTPPEPQATGQDKSLKSTTIETPQDNAPSIEPSPIDQTESVPPPNQEEPLQSTKLEELRVESLPQIPAIEQQETMKPKLSEPEVQPLEQTQTEVQIPIEEQMKKPSELRPKKKSTARRLRKAIMGY